jgi:naphthoate synthase
VADDNFVSELFDPAAWRPVEGFAGNLVDVTYHRATSQGTVRVAINRPEVRNAFRPRTVDELYACLDHARCSPDVGCVLLTGNGPSSKDGGWAFCSGGDQRVRGRAGYEYEQAKYEQGKTVTGGRALVAPTCDTQAGSTPVTGAPVGDAPVEDARVESSRDEQAKLGRLHILEVQRLIRSMPKVVIAVVPGWAAGGGHSLHVVADLTLASAEHARFRQTDADVASFDGGYGSAYLARQVGQKRAREIFFVGRTYGAEEAYKMGMVNAVVPHASLEAVALEWAAEVNAKSPMAVRMLKYAFNLADDGLAGQQLFAGEATRLAYMTEEAAEGRDAFLGRRRPDWSPFPWYY